MENAVSAELVLEFWCAEKVLHKKLFFLARQALDFCTCQLEMVSKASLLSLHQAAGERLSAVGLSSWVLHFYPNWLVLFYVVKLLIFYIVLARYLWKLIFEDV